jgi:hypothetical protein
VKNPSHADWTEQSLSDCHHSSVRSTSRRSTQRTSSRCIRARNESIISRLRALLRDGSATGSEISMARNTEWYALSGSGHESSYVAVGGHVPPPPSWMRSRRHSNVRFLNGSWRILVEGTTVGWLQVENSQENISRRGIIKRRRGRFPMPSCHILLERNSPTRNRVRSAQGPPQKDITNFGMFQI